MSLYDVAEWLILVFWAYTLWWAFTKQPADTPFADQIEQWLMRQPIRRRHHL